MSIASEISRLQTAKVSIKSAIEAKGVTVSSSATLEDYPSLIGSISGGGTQRRSITISDTSLTSSSNINTYFGGILDDWDTKPYILILKETPTAVNEITNIFSGYLYDMGFVRVWRANSGLTSFNNTDYINRNIVVVSGHTYEVYELDMMK